MSPRTHKFVFYLDENFPEPAGKFFRELGHKVIDGKRQIGFGKTDRQHLATAKKMGAVLVSVDRDFRIDRDLYQQVQLSPGIILIRSGVTNLTTYRTVIRRILKQSSPHQFEGKLCQASFEEIHYE